MTPSAFALPLACLMLLTTVELSAKRPSVYLHTQSELNTIPQPINSHAGVEQYSVLEPIYAYTQTISAKKLNTDRTAIYPRIKHLPDGRYLLLCQGGQVASRIYYYMSDDLKNWSDGRLLFAPYAVKTSSGADTRCFSTADAVVLANGDLLVACSFRASAGYKSGVGCGILLKRSSDNGETWTDEQVIFGGPNWEPYLLQLPDGRIQCYFTDCNPKERNSGTSVITSTDNGGSWQGYMRICRQYKYTDNGVRIYTDQMPCFRVLNDGKSLLGFLEARLESVPQGKSSYMMSLVYNPNFDWQPLGEQGTGPVDRTSNLFEGCAGYISTFPSGETLISCNINRLFSLKIGSSTGRTFKGNSWTEDWFQPFAGSGFWGSLESVDAHHVVGSMHCDEGIQLGLFYLNHRIDAPRAKIKIDGNSNEWKGDQALFVGSDSPVQAVFRASYDERNLYLLVECCNCPNDAAIVIFVEELSLRLTAAGITSANRHIRSACCQATTATGELGYVAEIAIPRSAIGVKTNDLVRFNAILQGEKFTDTFTGAIPEKPDTWMRIRLK